mmetsp:Transcript_102869/g.235961  ORF Transcript_102869/g.235961 Transcript_102869/m.235961 type:complete len:833 (-) Transcript_102869:13-2511(-)
MTGSPREEQVAATAAAAGLPQSGPQEALEEQPPVAKRLVQVSIRRASLSRSFGTFFGKVGVFAEAGVGDEILSRTPSSSSALNPEWEHTECLEVDPSAPVVISVLVPGFRLYRLCGSGRVVVSEHLSEEEQVVEAKIPLKRSERGSQIGSIEVGLAWATDASKEASCLVGRPEVVLPGLAPKPTTGKDSATSSETDARSDTASVASLESSRDSVSTGRSASLLSSFRRKSWFGDGGRKVDDAEDDSEPRLDLPEYAVGHLHLEVIETRGLRRESVMRLRLGGTTVQHSEEELGHVFIVTDLLDDLEVLLSDTVRGRRVMRGRVLLPLARLLKPSLPAFLRPSWANAERRAPSLESWFEFFPAGPRLKGQVAMPAGISVQPVRSRYKFCPALPRAPGSGLPAQKTPLGFVRLKARLEFRDAWHRAYFRSDGMPLRVLLNQRLESGRRRDQPFDEAEEESLHSDEGDGREQEEDEVKGKDQVAEDEREKQWATLLLTLGRNWRRVERFLVPPTLLMYLASFGKVPSVVLTFLMLLYLFYLAQPWHLPLLLFGLFCWNGYLHSCVADEMNKAYYVVWDKDVQPPRSMIERSVRVKNLVKVMARGLDIAATLLEKFSHAWSWADVGVTQMMLCSGFVSALLTALAMKLLGARNLAFLLASGVVVPMVVAVPAYVTRLPELPRQTAEIVQLHWGGRQPAQAAAPPSPAVGEVVGGTPGSSPPRGPAAPPPVGAAGTEEDFELDQQGDGEDGVGSTSLAQEESLEQQLIFLLGTISLYLQTFAAGMVNLLRAVPHDGEIAHRYIARSQERAPPAVEESAPSSAIAGTGSGVRWRGLRS